MKNKKLDTLISLSPFVIAVLVPIGRYVFGKITKSKKTKSNTYCHKNKKTD